MSYNRALSPSDRRADPRFADAVADAYQSHRHNSSVLPRTSHDRVIPISTQTYMNGAPSSSSTASRTTGLSYDSYGSRDRRSSLVDGSRSSATTTSARSRPKVIQGDAARGMSPPRDDRGYYITTSSAKDGRGSRSAKKVYTMDSGGAILISDTDLRPEDDLGKHRHRRHHRRTDSEDRPHRDAERQTRTARRDKSIDDADAFSYTDAAGMYRETQPTWRERDVRPRRGSLDRYGESRERPRHSVDLTAARMPRDNRPPPSQRGWDKVHDTIGRTKSMREGPREVEISPQRDREDDRYRLSQQPASRHTSRDRSAKSGSRRDEYDAYASDGSREQPRERRLSAHKAKDRSVSRRGFGIRVDGQDRRIKAGSDDSFDAYDRDTPGYSTRQPDIASDAEEAKQYRERKMDRRYDDEYYSELENTSHRKRESQGLHGHRRDDSRSHRTESSHGAGAKLVAGGLAAGAGAAAVHGLSKDQSDYNRQRNSDDSHGRAEAHPDNSERRRSTRPESIPYPDERAGDHGLGFAFEGPADKSRTDPVRSDTSRDLSRDDQRRLERTHEDMPPSLQDNAPLHPDDEYRQRMLQAERELGRGSTQASDDADRERRRRERELRMQHRRDQRSVDEPAAGASSFDRSPTRSSFDSAEHESSATAPTDHRPGLQRRSSIMDEPMPVDTQAVILDNTLSEQRETRVRIVDPPTEEEEKRPRGILKRPTQKFPEDQNVMREGVAPLKDSTKKGIPPGARWTKIDRRLVNPQALEDAKERYEERQDCVIVLRVLTKEEIQKLADKTKALREKRFESERRSEKRTSHRDHDRYDRDEYSDDGLEEWERDEKRPMKMLEAAPTTSDNDRRFRQA